MKILKICFIIIAFLILSVSVWFIYTRFGLPRYEMNGSTINYKNIVYIREETWSEEDTENLGKTIGIAVEGKRVFTDYIWPYWVIEYKNDKEHNRILVRGLMDVGTVYEKEIK